jgi:hypothetical protein
VKKSKEVLLSDLEEHEMSVYIDEELIESAPNFDPHLISCTNSRNIWREVDHHPSTQLSNLKHPWDPIQQADPLNRSIATWPCGEGRVAERPVVQYKTGPGNVITGAASPLQVLGHQNPVAAVIRTGERDIGAALTFCKTAFVI